MADLIAKAKPRNNRKRKADEAKIGAESQDMKRLKIVSPGKGSQPQSIIPKANTEAAKAVADAESLEFEKLINASDSDVPEATPDDKTADQIPKTIPEGTCNAHSEQSDPSGSSLTNKKDGDTSNQSKNPEIAKAGGSSSAFQWGSSDAANTGFGSFESKDIGFGSFGAATGFDTKSKVEGGWATPREFKFDADNSQFSFAEITRDGVDKEDGERKEEFGFPSHFGQDPVAKLAGKEADTGDAEDSTVYELKGRVRELVEMKWIERGTGEVKLNTYSAGKDGKIKARLLCRRELTLKTILNAVITKDTEFIKRTAKALQFTTFEQQQADEKEEDVDLKIVPKTYMLTPPKGQGHEKVDKLLEEIKKVQDQM